MSPSSSSLPNELHTRIFVHSSLIDFFNIRFVSDHLNQLIQRIKFTHRIKISSTDVPSNVVNVKLRNIKEDLSLERMKHIESLRVSRDILLNFDSCIQFRQLSHLKSIDLSGSKIHNSYVNHLERLEQLEDVNLEKCLCLTDDALFYLSLIKNLKKLNISRTCFTGKGLRYLIGKRLIEELNIQHINLNSDTSLRLFIQFPNLKKLKIGCDSFNADDIEYLTNITELSLKCKKITQKLLDDLNDLKIVKLRIGSLSSEASLEIKNMVELEDLTLNIKFNIIEIKLNNLKRLKKLNLTFTSIDLHPFIGCEELEKVMIEINEDYLTDLRQLKDLKKLKCLNLNFVDDDTIKIISELTSLKKLYLYCEVEHQIENIKKLTFIKSLIIETGRLEPDYSLDLIKRFESMRNLKKLTVDDFLW